MAVPWLENGMTPIVEPWYTGQFCHRTPNLDKSPEVDERISKIGSRIIIICLRTRPAVTQWSGSGETEAYLSGQLASFSALTLLVGSYGL